MSKIQFTDLHIHSEYSLQDGMIRIVDSRLPKGEKSAIIRIAEERGTGAVCVTDHGNMYCQALLASVCNKYGLKHIPGCEFYMALDHRTNRDYENRSDAYVHLNAWAINKEGYKNLCRLQYISYTEGFYYAPRVDRESIQRYKEGIIFSDACIGGTIGTYITKQYIDGAYNIFRWFADTFRDKFVIEYHNHRSREEDISNKYKVEWANRYGIPIIACTDAHYENKEDAEAHRALLCIQYKDWLENPEFHGFYGDGYHLMTDDELIERFPIEYINNTQYIVDMVEENIIEFGDIQAPKFEIEV